MISSLLKKKKKKLPDPSLIFFSFLPPPYHMKYHITYIKLMVKNHNYQLRFHFCTKVIIDNYDFNTNMKS